MVLQLTLGRAMRATKGAGTPEIGQAYTRARELCQQVGETSQFFAVLDGLHDCYVAQGKHQMTNGLAEQLLSLAQRQRDPARLVTGHRRMGQSLFWLGELSAAHAHLKQAIALDDPQQHPAAVYSGGRSPDWFARNLAALAWTARLHQYRREERLAQERADTCLTPRDRAWLCGTCNRKEPSCGVGRWPHRDEARRG
jgi:adenylate cyclase